jgi:hypothetical protein
MGNTFHTIYQYVQIYILRWENMIVTLLLSLIFCVLVLGDKKRNSYVHYINDHMTMNVLECEVEGF